MEWITFDGEALSDRAFEEALRRLMQVGPEIERAMALSLLQDQEVLPAKADAIAARILLAVAVSGEVLEYTSGASFILHPKRAGKFPGSIRALWTGLLSPELKKKREQFMARSVAVN